MARKKCDHGKRVCNICHKHLYCTHNKLIRMCVVCGGSGLCAHGKHKSQCVICAPHRTCMHNKIKDWCAVCATTHCTHGKRKSLCVDCGGNNLCQHNRRRDRCIECGTEYCIHGTRKRRCIECGGSQICEHNKDRHTCKHCKPLSYLAMTTRNRINSILASTDMIKTKHTIDYIGCSNVELKSHLENQFTPEMTWDNHGTYWHVDHIIPLMYDQDNLTEEILISRMHYTNLQPLTITENLSKGNRYIG